MKDAYVKEDKPEEQKMTKVTVNFNKWADFRAFEGGEMMEDGLTIEEVRTSFLVAMKKCGAEKMQGQAPKPEIVRVVERQFRANLER